MNEALEIMNQLGQYFHMLATEGVNIQTSWTDVLTAVSTTSAVLIALFYEPLIKRINRPIIAVKVGNDIPFCRYTSSAINLRTATTTRQNAYWIRLKIQNTGRSAIKKCEGKLLAIANEDLSLLRDDFDPVILHWVGSDQVSETSGPTPGLHYTKVSTVDINSSEYEYLDLLCSESNRNTFDIQAIDTLPRGMNFSPPKDTYYFLISLYSETAESVSEVLKLEYGNVYDDITLSKAVEIERRKFYELLV